MSASQPLLPTKGAFAVQWRPAPIYDAWVERSVSGQVVRRRPCGIPMLSLQSGLFGVRQHFHARGMPWACRIPR